MSTACSTALESPSRGMPTTRYQGSKRKLLPLLEEVFKAIPFTSCLDAFGGTGSVSHLLSRMGKRVHYNDILPSNRVIASALFANGPLRLKRGVLPGLLQKKRGRRYQTIIEDHYAGIYFLDEENRELDAFCENVCHLESEQERAEAFYLLFQSLLSKRPYNLFHRANLELRTRRVKRSFGNKSTWDRPLLRHMEKFYSELEAYRCFAGERRITWSCCSAFELTGQYDLVYIDTPYAKGEGAEESNYFNFYHFLDALLDYQSIPERLHRERKHRPIYPQNKKWHPFGTLDDAFKHLIDCFSPAVLVLSYRSDGSPTPERLQQLLGLRYEEVSLVPLSEYRYVLSKRGRETKEIVLVASSPKSGKEV